MATEKASKSALLYLGTPVQDVSKTHRALVHLLKVIGRHRRAPAILGIPARQLQAHVRGSMPLAAALESLAPAVAHGAANSEYPWEEPSGSVVVPASHEFPEWRDVRGPLGIRLIKLSRRILARLEDF